MQKADYQTRILKLEKTLEDVLQIAEELLGYDVDKNNYSEINPLLEEAKDVLYEEALDEEGDI